ncbi:MAG: hypothetical protein M1814_001381 [Vezdaea aestivalis]|nr:MAG: hypothetical protein M1814_001381 [Vezdaea aestivalis]
MSVYFARPPRAAGPATNKVALRPTQPSSVRPLNPALADASSSAIRNLAFLLQRPTLRLLPVRSSCFFEPDRSLILQSYTPFVCSAQSLSFIPRLSRLAGVKLPSLAIPRGHSHGYWPDQPVHHSSRPETSLPTPPTSDSEVFKAFPATASQQSSTVATSLVHHPVLMNPADGLGQPSSLTARRPAASNLPLFQLPPPPPDASVSSKFPPLTFNGSQSSPGNVGNLLTPPSNLSADSISPLSSGLHSSGSAGSSSAIPAYPSVGAFWQTPPPGVSPYGLSSAPPAQTTYSTQSLPPGFPMTTRSVFSPSLGSLVRNASSSASGEGLPPPPSDLPPFPYTMSMSSSAGTSLPNLSAQHSAIAANFMNSQTTSATTQPSPVHAPEPYNSRLPPTPSYYGSQPSSAQQASFPTTYTAPSPSQSSPASRISPTTGQSAHQTPMTSASPYSRPFGFPLPAMGGPIMSNLHSPGGQMSLVGGMSSGLMGSYNGAGGQVSHLYGGASTNSAPTPPNDRPFKCDQCPQSFNRNHDLKRHKRIHLAVKPFPCGHCEKSFSRKDALKRHVLVKGCGKAPVGEINNDGSNSPPDRSASSDGGEGSPGMNGTAPVKAEI